jgi:neutral ceramidase
MKHISRIGLLRLGLSCLFCLSFLDQPSFAQTRWKAGAAKVSITPSEPIWLAGYANRSQPSTGVLAEIYVKALALDDGSGKVSVIVTSDLLGLSRALVDAIAEQAKLKYNIPQERLILSASHSHSGPVTGDLLFPFYQLDGPQKKAVERYTATLLTRFVEVIGRSISDLAPADLSFGQGLAGVAVNRRRSRPATRHLPGPVDHDVPVLCVRNADGTLKAVLFGYACHATALSGYTIHGDYPGFAQAAIEKKHQGATALFMAGCGADANPLPRIMGSDAKEAVELAERSGLALAAAVELTLKDKMASVEGSLNAAFERVKLSLQPPPNRTQLVDRLPGKEGLARRELENMIRLLDENGSLPESALYPLQVWQFGVAFKLIALGGEPVVDYSLRFKARYGWESTWVVGYTNDLLSYIPSLRVLREGGYEGGDGMMMYGLPSPYAESIERLIADKVDELIRRTTPAGR